MNTHAHIADKTAFGFWIYLMTDAVLFAGLFAAYAVLQSATFGAPAVYEFARLDVVFLETILLLTSSFTVGLALLAARHHKKALALMALFATGALGLAFLGIELQEFAHLVAEGAGPWQSASLSAFFVLVGTHGLHVALGLLWMLVLVVHVAARGLTAGTLRKLSLLAQFWHFLDLIWIFIFTFVYLLGILAL